MPRSKPAYSLLAKNHVTGEQIKIELLALPFTERTFRLRVNGKAALKLPIGSKTRVLAQLRKWWVAH